MPWAAVAAAAPIVGGVIGNVASAGDREQAKQDALKGYQKLIDTGTPPDMAQRVILEQYKSAGTLTPELEQTISQAPSLMQGAKADQSSIDAQHNALQLLQQRANSGLNATDRAGFNQLRNQAAQDAQARQAQIQQNFQARGMGGSGSELAAALSGGQASAQREAEGSDRLASTASQNALQAAMATGQLGGGIRSQDFGEQSARAQAQDAINRFNSSNAQGVAGRNTERANYGQQYNLQNAQNVANANTAMNNNESYRQLAGQQMNWNNQNTQNKLQSQGDLGQAGVYGDQAKQTQQFWANMGSGAAKGASAIAGSGAGAGAGNSTNPDTSSYGNYFGGQYA